MVKFMVLESGEEGSKTLKMIIIIIIVIVIVIVIVIINK